MYDVQSDICADHQGSTIQTATRGASSETRSLDLQWKKADSIFLLMPYLLNDIRLHSHQVLIIQGPNQAGARRRFLNFELSK
jgi:hypothetical protein